MIQLSIEGNPRPFHFSFSERPLLKRRPPTDPAPNFEVTDLNTLLAPHAGRTFLMEAGTDLMAEAGIHKGDLLVVDRSLAVDNGQIVVARVADQLIIRRYEEVSKSFKLTVDSAEVSPLMIPPYTQEIIIWGVVTHVIHTL